MKISADDITRVIRSRRSIYPENYNNREIPRECIETIVTNATWAPTHGMTQPWRFKVFRKKSKEDLCRYMEIAYMESTPTGKQNPDKLVKMKNRIARSSAVIVICMHRQADTRVPEHEDLAAVACAVQNMHLTCTAMGIGAFWSTGSPVTTPAFHQNLKLSTNQRCVGLFYMGFTDMDWPEGHRAPVSEICEWKE